MKNLENTLERDKRVENSWRQINCEDVIEFQKILNDVNKHCKQLSKNEELSESLKFKFNSNFT